MAEVYKRRGSDKWQAKCWYLGQSGHRKVHRESTGIRDDGTVKSRQTAEEVARQIERRLVAGGEARKSPTLKQAFNALAAAKDVAELRESTIGTATDRMMHLENHFGPGMHLSDIGPAEVLQYAIEAKKERKAITVLRELECLQQAYRTLGLTPPKLPDVGDTSPKPQRVLEVHEQRSLLMAVPTRRRLSVQAYLQLGLRQSELWKIESIDWVARYVIVAGTKTAGSRREVPLGDELHDALWPHRDNWRACFPKWGKSAQHQCLALAGERAGIGPVHCNDFRGTFATMHARAGTPQMVLASIMGNSPKMLEKVYAQLKIRGEHHHEFTKRGVPRLKSASPMDGVGQADEAVGDCAQSVRETVAHTANTDTKRGGKLVSIRRKD